MTQDELKRIEKKINSVQDPLGRGFPSLRRILQETAALKSTTEFTILQEYMYWKSSHI